MSTRSMGNLTLNIIANTGSFEEGANRAERAMDKMNKSVNRQKQEFNDLVAQIDPVVAELAKLDRMQQQLEKHKSTGVVDEAGYSKVSAAISGMRREVEFSNSALVKQQREFGKLINQIDPAVGKLAELDRMQDQLRQGFSAGWIDQAEFNRLDQSINTSRASLMGAEAQITKTGMSSKQLNAALRGIPAQFTDIAVSLAAGQNPLTVFLQQGGQLKDMFGGAGPAAKALGGYILGLINPYSAAAAGVGVLALAYYQGSIEADKFRNALILTGNISGSTANQLAEMAESIDAVSGTQRQAATAIAEVAGTGKFAADQIELVSRSAVLMENVTGKAVSETVAEFEKLAKDPVKAVAELNEKYNFLTADVYEQIAALAASGKETEATNLAFKSYAEAIDGRTSEIIENLGYIEGAWKGLKKAGSEAWDSILGIGRSETLQSQIDEAKEKLELLKSSPVAGMVTPNQAFSRPDNTQQIAQQQELIRQLETQQWMQEMMADGDRLRAKLNKDAIAAQAEIAKITAETKTNDEKRLAAIKEYNSNLDKIRAADPSSALLDQAKIDKELAAIEAKFAETNKKITDSASQRMLAQITQQRAVLQGQLDGESKIGAARRELLKFDQQIADLKEKKILTADQKSLLAQESQVRAALAKNVSLEDEIRHRESINRLQAMQANIQSQIDADQERYGDRLQTMGMGDKARDRLREEERIRRDYQRQMNQATSDNIGGKITDDELSIYENMLQESLDIRLAMHADYYEREKELQGDWSIGAQEALQNYIDYASDIASQTEDIFAQAFGGLEDALFDFVATGELSFSSLLRNIAEETIRMLIRIGIQKMANFVLDKTIGAATGAGYVASVTGQATAMNFMAGLNAFASTAAIPIVGPAAAPAAMAAALAVSAPLAAGAITAASSSLAGMAHSGLDYIPNEGTWLLDKGERVLSPAQNSDLTRFLAATNSGSAGNSAGVKVEVINATGEQVKVSSERRGSGLTAQDVVKIFVGDMSERGPMHRSITQTTTAGNRI